MTRNAQDFIASAVTDARKRASGVLSSPSLLTDEDWTKITQIAYTTGTLSDVQKILFKERHDAVARAHFLNFVYELERLYEIICQMDKQLKGEAA